MRRLLDKRDVAELTHYHPEHVMRLARQNRFPAPIKMGDRRGCAVRWDAEEVSAWIAERMAARS